MSPKHVSLALQGGGSHGAFTWGVLDRLLDEPGLAIEAISGASAGAMNAVVLADGLLRGGRQGARQALRQFWTGVARRAPLRLLPEDAALDQVLRQQALVAPALGVLSLLTRYLSPYELNPFDINPLRDLVAAQVDFAALRERCPIELFIATTRVSTGRLRLFRRHQITLEAVLASACLPNVHRAVNIDGEAYWDGGFTANPPILPLVYEARAPDLIAVLLQPLRWPREPRSADEIGQRLGSLQFSVALAAELDALARAREEAQRGLLAFGTRRRLRRLRLHLIGADDLMSRMGGLSKLDAQPAFVHRLFEEGRGHAERWLAGTLALVGKRSTFALAAPG